MKTRRLMGIVLALMLMMASMSTAFAASNQDVLAELAKGLTLKTGKTSYILAKDFMAVQNYLMQKNLSSSELDGIVARISLIQARAKESSGIEDIKNDSVIKTAVKEAAAIAGVKVAIGNGAVEVDSNGQTLVKITRDTVSDKPEYAVINTGDQTESQTSGNAIKQSSHDQAGTQVSSDAIKQTGADINLTNMMMVISSTVVILAGACFVAFKFNLMKD